ncbi:hypothetical protein DFH07DRAFT_943159 [Mycena maculata]|uniref:Uncharacterized protein n=1 Tax=Mycena maculata TaxID=230809 RepID=A0AAD7IKZ9_9AGAR|nr:hypothetical protein DFH07DRAFT_943159 [Mycena maculata]
MPIPPPTPAPRARRSNRYRWKKKNAPSASIHSLLSLSLSCPCPELAIGLYSPTPLLSLPRRIASRALANACTCAGGDGAPSLRVGVPTLGSRRALPSLLVGVVAAAVAVDGDGEAAGVCGVYGAVWMRGRCGVWLWLAAGTDCVDADVAREVDVGRIEPSDGDWRADKVDASDTVESKAEAAAPILSAPTNPDFTFPDPELRLEIEAEVDVVLRDNKGEGAEDEDTESAEAEADDREGVRAGAVVFAADEEAAGEVGVAVEAAGLELALASATAAEGVDVLVDADEDALGLFLNDVASCRGLPSPVLVPGPFTRDEIVLREGAGDEVDEGGALGFRERGVEGGAGDGGDAFVDVEEEETEAEGDFDVLVLVLVRVTVEVEADDDEAEGDFGVPVLVDVDVVLVLVDGIALVEVEADNDEAAEGDFGVLVDVVRVRVPVPVDVEVAVEVDVVRERGEVGVLGAAADVDADSFPAAADVDVDVDVEVDKEVEVDTDARDRGAVAAVALAARLRCSRMSCCVAAAEAENERDIVDVDGDGVILTVFMDVGIDVDVDVGVDADDDGASGVEGLRGRVPLVCVCVEPLLRLLCGCVETADAGLVPAPRLCGRDVDPGSAGVPGLGFGFGNLRLVVVAEVLAPGFCTCAAAGTGSFRGARLDVRAAGMTVARGRRLERGGGSGAVAITRDPPFPKLILDYLVNYSLSFF